MEADGLNKGQEVSWRWKAKLLIGLLEAACSPAPHSDSYRVLVLVLKVLSDKAPDSLTSASAARILRASKQEVPLRPGDLLGPRRRAGRSGPVRLQERNQRHEISPVQ